MTSTRLFWVQDFWSDRELLLCPIGSVIGWFVILPTIYFIGQYAPEAIGLADLPFQLRSLGSVDLLLEIYRYWLCRHGRLYQPVQAAPIIYKSFKGTLQLTS